MGSTNDNFGIQLHAQLIDFLNLELEITPIEQTSNDKFSVGRNEMEYKFILNHKRLDEVNLKEEDNNKFLNEGNIMHNLSYNQCRRRLVQNGKGHSNKETITIFNTKRTILCYQKLLTYWSGVCRFCICYDCVCKMYNSRDENKYKARSTRRSWCNK